jgi:putative membrane protein
MTWIKGPAQKTGVSSLHPAEAPTWLELELEMEMEMDLHTRLRRIGLGAMTLAMTGVIAGSAFAQAGDGPGRNYSYYHGPGMMWGGGQWGGFGMVLGPIFMILVLVAIILGVLYLLRHFGGVGAGFGAEQADGRALAILKERYAKGEIDTAEFEERKAKLSS